MHNFFFFLIIFMFCDSKADSLYDPLGKYVGKIEGNGTIYTTHWEVIKEELKAMEVYIILWENT